MNEFFAEWEDNSLYVSLIVEETEHLIEKQELQKFAFADGYLEGMDIFNWIGGYADRTETLSLEQAIKDDYKILDTLITDHYAHLITN